MPILVVGVSKEDIIAFAEHNVARSPSIQGRRRRLRYGISVLLLVLGAAAAWYFDSLTVLAVAPVVAFWAWYSIPRDLQRSYLKQLESLVSEGANRSSLGQVSFDANLNRLRVTSPSGSSEIPWSSFQELTPAEGRVFLNIDPLLGFVIAKERVVEGDYGEFVAFVSARLESAAA